MLPGKTPSDDVKVMLSPGYAVWPPVAPLFMVPPPCKCNKPRPVRVRRPRKVYIDMNSRPIFLRPSETSDWTPEELCEYRKDWGKR
ncbi:hypothetical protein SEA_ABBYDAISY_39 [Arthrobacter phage AbbyDaisy]|nr:hypothetical protein SEA_ABBYDAISY_39 [Arthrobacter phage AbbyDaisy]